MTSKLRGWIRGRWRRHPQRGAQLVEYSLMVVFVALASFAALRSVGDGIRQNFSSIDSSISSQ